MSTKKIHIKWETIDGRPARVWCVFPQNRWPDADERPPLLLIHGLGCSGHTWKPTLRFLAEQGVDRPVYAPDMPGYGRSAFAGKVLGIAEMADWNVRLLDLLGVGRAHLAGNSMGCQVALALARRHPERVGALVLSGATDGKDLIPLWRTVAGLLADVLMEPPAYNLRLLWMYAQQGVPRYLITARKMNQDEPVDRAGEVRAPVLVLRGERDLIVPDRAARALAAALPNGQYRFVEGAAHAMQFGAPETFAPLALDFWRRAEAGFSANGAAGGHVGGE